ncbi:DUF3618 domain-containing protein [Kitasatospora aureofaciens]|uniref:DUF3618 domain-containing protein n=1 Tax=Kitasatospora aureofaciens TaxID=1894 RepID=UPI0004C65267|nr:DUF3618 domain-containing protein [Kitasatospora aureofaciens]
MTQPPHDEPTASSPEELRAQVERTRAELGETVQALTAKAEEKAAEVKAHKAAQAAGQARAKAAEVGHLWEEKAPEPVREKTARGAQLARDNRKVLVAAACVAVVLWLACRRRKG